MVMYWQNLLHQKCPICHRMLKRSAGWFKCEDAKCQFVISDKKAIEVITDPRTQKWMTEHERSTVNQALKGLGVVV